MSNEPVNFSELIQTSMKKTEHEQKYELMRDSLGILFPSKLEDWLAVSNLNSTQINELEKILLIKNMMLPDTCEFINDFVEIYLKINVSKSAHGRHDIRDIMQGFFKGTLDKKEELMNKLKGVVP
jgi:hypothetical protein